VIVQVREDQPGGKRLVAYVVPTPGLSSSSSQLRDFLRERLPDYMVPSAFVLLEQLPLTPNGKVDFKQLPKPPAIDEALHDSYVAPRDLVELEMARLWEEVLHIRPIGIYDEFFELGGHSLTAVELVGAIQVRFGVKLPLMEFLQKPTVEHLCTLLRDETILSTDCLILLQQGNNHTPIFVVHPQGGGVLCYLHLSKALGREETVYGLQAPGYDSDEPFLESIEEMADRYVKEIQRIAPHGPYRLVGWSMGGLIAYEIARRFETMGERIDFLGLLDVPAPPREEQVQTNVQHFVDQDEVLLDLAINYLELEGFTTTNLGEDEAYGLLLQRAKDLHLIPQEARRDFIQHQARIMMANQSVVDTYWCQSQIETDIHVFCAGEYSSVKQLPLVAAEKWQHFTRGKVYKVSVPGNHHTMVKPPFVSTLAEAMKAALPQQMRLFCFPLHC
ncbi:MAG TPA: alpha/beta fold hydrolase, partial [Ktedonobacteraceae bacterium]|nr:alpha/beta fold hydrolase [Ktedonobacteraceae bacterium]